MFQNLWDTVQSALGLNADSLDAGQMALRSLIVYLAAIAMVRVGEKRFLGKNTAFDVILGIILGSVVSRAITGSSSFFATLGAGVMLVGLHWLVAVMTFHSDRLGNLFKGYTRVLVEDGTIDWDQMRKSHTSKDDLRAALRRQANMDDIATVRFARLERSGDISVVEQSSSPRVVEVQVADGVQTVRIELGS